MVVGLLAAVGVWLVCGWPVLTLAALAGGLLLPRMWAARATAAEQAGRSEAVAEVAAGLRDAVRGGLGVTDALGGLARWGPPALRSELAELSAQAAVAGLPQALEGFARRLADPLADLLAATLALNHRLGGRNLSGVLDDPGRRHPRRSPNPARDPGPPAPAAAVSRLVAAAPLLILVAIRQTNPAYLAPFDTPLGQGVLGLALLLITIGYLAMVRLARPPAGTRLLPVSPSAAGGLR